MSGRIPAIEGCRALAASSVLIYHAWLLDSGYDESSPAGWLLSRFWAGVPVFFAISGYVLYRPYWAATVGARPWPETRLYFARRCRRILPAYWACLTVLIAVGINTNGGVVQNYLLIQNIWPDSVSLVPVCWTLVCEAMFYIALPFIAIGLRKAGSRRRSQAVILLLILVGLVARAAFIEAGQTIHDATLLTTIDLFAAGMLAATLSTTRAAPAGVALICAAFPLLATYYGLFGGGTENAVGGLMVAFGFALCLPAIPRARILSSRSLVALGTISYGVYLWHQPVLRAAHNTLPQLDFLTLMLGGGAIAIAIASASWVLIEKPMIGTAFRVPRPVHTVRRSPTST